ncbi:hypothetical protein NEOC95_000243 [Neochlamydia sp. AcF95]|nr:hypothetical protein [Neochlamydia sp. AcF95]
MHNWQSRRKNSDLNPIFLSINVYLKKRNQWFKQE